MTTVGSLPALDTAHGIDDAQVAAYRENGHTLVPGLATPDEITAYRRVIGAATMRYNSETRALAERDTYGKAFLQVTNLWRRDEDVARFVLARRFASVAARLMGVEKVRLYHDQALFKEAGGGHTPWHQDSMYWPFDTDLTVTMWMPLVDVAADMGGLSFASGSHHARALSEFDISDASEEHFDRLLRDGRYPVADNGPMRAGDASFHAGWTLHRALSNRSDTVREVMTVIWVADGVRVAEPANHHQASDLATWLPGQRPGDLVGSNLNPLLPR
jgi:ectoine hydroxylase-related dioxygenase (phytanoyl-CoA dioxygenase family)